MKKLSEHFKKNKDYETIEETITDKETLIDEGFYLELYGHPEGVNSALAEGSSAYIFIDKEIKYGELLAIYDDLGEISDGTLTICLVGENGEKKSFCLENPISSYNI